MLSTLFTKEWNIEIQKSLTYIMKVGRGFIIKTYALPKHHTLPVIITHIHTFTHLLTHQHSYNVKRLCLYVIAVKYSYLISHLSSFPAVFYIPNITSTHTEKPKNEEKMPLMCFVVDSLKLRHWRCWFLCWILIIFSCSIFCQYCTVSKYIICTNLHTNTHTLRYFIFRII